MKITAERFGTLPDGQDIYAYTLENNDMQVEIINYGAVVRSLRVPDRNGKLADVVLGHETLEDYTRNTEWFGAAVGRNANRIADARLRIFDDEITLEKNDGEHNLHAGSHSLAHRVFTCEAHTFNNLPALLLTHTMEDGSDGFPGNLIVTVAYALTEDNALMIDYRAVCDKDTVINLTNHSYFNLAGHDAGNIYGQELELDAPFYTPCGEGYLPTGEVLRVAGTPLDFTAPKALGKDIHDAHEQIQLAGGFDHNFVLAGSGYRKVATAHDPSSGRVMTLLTDLPGVQLYTANSLTGETACKGGIKYGKHGAFCLETQLFPNAVNTPWFPSPIYTAGEEYTSTTTYQFSVR